MRIMCVLGTRAEAIRMASIINELKQNNIEVLVCVNNYHDETIEQTLNFFNINIDIDLNVMAKSYSSINQLSCYSEVIDKAFIDFTPDFVIVQGGELLSVAAALSAYYKNIPVIHLDAGIRIFEKNLSPINDTHRKLITSLATYHYVHSIYAKSNLLREGIDEKSIFLTSNTLFDSFYTIIQKFSDDSYYKSFSEKFDFLGNHQKVILVTQNKYNGCEQVLENLCYGLKLLAEDGNTQIVFPVNLNSHIQKKLHKILGDVANVFLIPPVNYASFVYLMSKSYFIITDSESIQLEAPLLQKPVLLNRDTTEFWEMLETGTIRLVGTQKNTLIQNAMSLLYDSYTYKTMCSSTHPFVQGNYSYNKGAKQIVLNLLNSIKAKTILKVRQNT